MRIRGKSCLSFSVFSLEVGRLCISDKRLGRLKANFCTRKRRNNQALGIIKSICRRAFVWTARFLAIVINNLRIFIFGQPQGGISVWVAITKTQVAAIQACTYVCVHSLFSCPLFRPFFFFFLLWPSYPPNDYPQFNAAYISVLADKIFRLALLLICSNFKVIYSYLIFRAHRLHFPLSNAIITKHPTVACLSHYLAGNSPRIVFTWVRMWLPIDAYLALCFALLYNTQLLSSAVIAIFNGRRTMQLVE